MGDTIEDQTCLQNKTEPLLYGSHDTLSQAPSKNHRGPHENILYLDLQEESLDQIDVGFYTCHINHGNIP